jgi:hypothetical protein
MLKNFIVVSNAWTFIAASLVFTLQACSPGTGPELQSEKSEKSDLGGSFVSEGLDTPEQRAFLAAPVFKAREAAVVQPSSDGMTQPSFLAVKKVCSNRYTERQGTNLLAAAGANIKVALFADTSPGGSLLDAFKTRIAAQVLDHVDGSAVKPLQLFENRGPAIVADIVRSGKFEADLAAVPDGNYKVVVCANPQNCDLNSAGSFRDGSDITMTAGKITVQGGKLVAQTEPISILYDKNDQMRKAATIPTERSPLNADLLNMKNSRHRQSTALSLADDPYTRSDSGISGGSPGQPNGSDFGGGTTDPCDRRISPLMIDLADATGSIELSVPRAKIFDLSAIEDPTKLVPDSISWMGNPTTYFLALDKNGNGSIDSGYDLFGDVNINPVNGKPFENGFEDLAQYDSNNDHVINSSDPIFERLRLWQGEIQNGVLVATPALKKLSEMNITAIDLNYEQLRLPETDFWGNQTKYRSFVGLHDAKAPNSLKFHRIFDLYFRLYTESELSALHKVYQP